MKSFLVSMARRKILLIACAIIIVLLIILAFILRNCFCGTETINSIPTTSTTQTGQDISTTPVTQKPSEIIPENRPPVFDEINNKSVVAGDLIEFSILANDPDNDMLTYSAPIRPVGATFNNSTGVFSWLPLAGDVGDHPVSFKVTDGKLEDIVNITITVTAPTTVKPPSVKTIEVGGKIYYMALSPDRNKLYAVDIGPGGVDNQGSIFVINTNTDAEETVIKDLGQGFPFQIRLSPDGTKAYVAVTQGGGSTTTSGTNRIIVFNTASPQDRQTMLISGNNTFGPVGLVLSPSGEYTYATHRGIRRVDGFNNLTNGLISSVVLSGSGPSALAIHPNGDKLYVADPFTGTTTVVDVNTSPYSIIRELQTGLTTNNSHSFITVTQDGSRIFVTDAGDGRIAVIQVDKTSGLPIGDISYIATTATGLRQLAISPDGKRALVTSNTKNVLVIDLVNNTQIGEIPIGQSSFGVVWTDLPGVVAYVSSGNNIITKIIELP